MLIGNRTRFAFELTPVEPTWERRYAPEAAAWAGFALWVEGKNLCAHIRDGEEGLRTAFFVPLAPLADWFVGSYPALCFEERASWFPTSRQLHAMVRRWGESVPSSGINEDAWLNARERFWLGHFLLAGAEGARVPNVAFLRQDDDLVVSWAEDRNTSEPRVTMLNGDGMTVVGWNEFNTTVGDFVRFVADAFSHRDGMRPYHWMEGPLDQVPLPEANATVELFCARSAGELAELLGVTEVDLANVLSLQHSPDPGASAVCQVVRDLPPRPSPGVGRAVLTTVTRAMQAGTATKPRWRRLRDLARDAAGAGETPEKQGQLAARAVRAELRLDGAPIPSTECLLADLDVALLDTDVPAFVERMLVAAAAPGSAAATILRTERTETPWGRRFEQVRAAAHVLLDPLRGGVLGAASTGYAQETRRRRSGAFAAEVLLPETALIEARGGGLDSAAAPDAFRGLIERYGVGARTAAYQLFNHGLLSNPGIRDELIEVHGGGNTSHRSG